MNLQSNNSILNNISVFLLLVFPACLVIGPFAAEISMNLIVVFFLIDIFKNKNFSIFRNKFMLFFFLFYFYIILNSFFSNYSANIFFSNIFYIRYVFFIFAVVNLLSINKKLNLLFYKFLLLTIFLVVLDGFIQFFFKSNILGYQQVRADRISGLFGDKLILGSYLSRIFPLMVGLFFYNLELLKLKYKVISSILIILSFILIAISGDRSPFIVSSIFLFIIFILISAKKIFKILGFLVFLVLTTLIFFKFPILLERHYNQTVQHVNFKLKNDNLFSGLRYYSETYQTAFKAFYDKKIFGHGARSFRYFCSDKKYETTREDKEQLFLLVLATDQNQEIILDTFNLSEGKEVKKGELLFSYFLEGKLRNYYAEKSFKVISFTVKSSDIGKIIDENKIINISYLINGCTTHPHNFYLQILSETGIVGFFFIFGLFLYCIMKIWRNFYFRAFHRKVMLTNFQICLLMGFILTLLPIIPNGNFFNNWLSMINFLPVGFYISSLKRNDA